MHDCSVVVTWRDRVKGGFYQCASKRNRNTQQYQWDMHDLSSGRRFWRRSILAFFLFFFNYQHMKHKHIASFPHFLSSTFERHFQTTLCHRVVLLYVHVWARVRHRLLASTLVQLVPVLSASVPIGAEEPVWPEPMRDGVIFEIRREFFFPVKELNHYVILPYQLPVQGKVLVAWFIQSHRMTFACQSDIIGYIKSKVCCSKIDTQSN